MADYDTSKFENAVNEAINQMRVALEAHDDTWTKDHPVVKVYMEAERKMRVQLRAFRAAIMYDEDDPDRPAVRPMGPVVRTSAGNVEVAHNGTAGRRVSDDVAADSGAADSARATESRGATGATGATGAGVRLGAPDRPRR